jgi:bifunctional non-homologous end joining protein LigD
MRAETAVALPADDEAWAYEVKWDGYRMLALVDGGRLRLQTRNLIDATAEFPALAGLASAVGPIDVVLDGEVVAFDAAGRPSFDALQQRGRQATEVRYLIFDVLEIDGRSTCALPWRERRRLLEQLGLDHGAAWQLSPAHVGGGAAVLAATESHGLEGIIAKRVDSRYEPGRRSGAWRKIKHWGRQEFVVGGWMPGKGGRTGGIGSLLLGVHDDAGRLRYCGRVGTGLTDAALDRIAGLLAPLAAAETPFDPVTTLPPEVRRLARHVRPELVVEVAFSAWTPTGTVRHPSFKGLRTDKSPAEVVREQQ